MHRGVGSQEKLQENVEMKVLVLEEQFAGTGLITEPLVSVLLIQSVLFITPFFPVCFPTPGQFVSGFEEIVGFLPVYGDQHESSAWDFFFGIFCVLSFRARVVSTLYFYTIYDDESLFHHLLRH